MLRKEIDDRIQIFIENGINNGHRTLFIIVGENGKNQVVLLHHMLIKLTIVAEKSKSSSILWCSKKEIAYIYNNRNKRIKLIKNKVKSDKFDVNEDNLFESFMISNNICHCYYNETQKILGNTYQMCILQDFEAITPNLLAQTVETVEGGGLIIILLPSMTSLKQFYTMNMDVHQRFRTEAHQNIVCRFNERFLLSLSSCKRCLVLDDDLSVLPITIHNIQSEIVTNDLAVDENNDLNVLKECNQNNQIISVLLNCCKTLDQTKVLLNFIEIISKKKLNATVSLTAARGRGKSATLGLAIAGAVAFNYSNICITSPNIENSNTLFEFIMKGFNALDYKENVDYEFIQCTNTELNKTTPRINISRDNHQQIIQYIHPSEVNKLNCVELLVIDEAAAIPLPHVKAMLGHYLVFLSSTINGYEGTGRSLSLKLLHQLRMQNKTLSNSYDPVVNENNLNKVEKLRQKDSQLYELTLDESIRYKTGDKVEEWLNHILCLNVEIHPFVISNFPHPNTCQLYYINRETLFSYHKASELFLQNLVAIYVASHYKNTPNDLQMMADAPAHHLFCLLGPIDANCKKLPEILVFIQVCLEGGIKNETIADGLKKGCRASGDLIPWTVAQQYQDNDFAQLKGARIVRIATNSNYHGMGYGTKALELLKQYYKNEIPKVVANMSEITNKNVCIHNANTNLLLHEKIEPRKSLPPLLSKLNERSPEKLNYLGVSFGLTKSLLKFWKRSNFVLVYLRQTANDITGEHSCIMLSELTKDKNKNCKWLKQYWKEFRRRFITLLSYSFATYSPLLALDILTNDTLPISNSTINKIRVTSYFTSHDFKRLVMYSKNIVDYHLIMDLIPSLAKFYFMHCENIIHFSSIQVAILIGIGLQRKTMDKIADELGLPVSELLGLFNRIVHKFLRYLNDIVKQLDEKRTIARTS